MTLTPRRGRDTSASLAQAERLAQNALSARQRSEHFSQSFLSHCKSESHDEGFLLLLLNAALDPAIHPQLAAQSCLEGVAKAATALRPRDGAEPRELGIDPAPLLALILPLCSDQPLTSLTPPAPPSRGAFPPDDPWRCLAFHGWGPRLAKALLLAKDPRASEIAPFALLCGGSAESIRAAEAEAGWSPSSALARQAAFRCIETRDAERLSLALASGLALFPERPPHPMEAHPLAGLAAMDSSVTESIAHVRQRLGLPPEPAEPFFEAGLQAIMASPCWAALPKNQQASWAQRFFDDAFAAGDEGPALSPETRGLLKSHGVNGATAWATQRKIERLLASQQRRWSSSSAAGAREDAQCHRLILEAARMLPLLRAAEPGEPPITPLCVLLIEALGGDPPPPPMTEKAIRSVMDAWSGSSFGERALRWMEARSGQTHSAPNAICSLPRTKKQDYSEPGARWLGAFLAQGFDPEARASPKSKSLGERAASLKTLGPLYAAAESIALRAASSQRPPASAEAKLKNRL